MRSRLALASLLLLLLPGPAWAASSPPQGPPANIRPTFGSGYTWPGGAPGYAEGFGLGAAFEIERSRAASFLFRVECDWLMSPPRGARPLSGLEPYPEDVAHFSWTAGIRGYLPSRGTLRFYGELDAGVRMGGDNGDHEGPVLAPRMGLAVASLEGAGAFVEVGANFTTRDPERSLFVPLRFGIIFP